MKKNILMLLFLSLFAISLKSFASGAFMPGGGVHLNEKYNLGKAIVAGRLDNVSSCKSCHQKFSRSKLKSLETSVSVWISQCEKHAECYKDILNETQKSALDVYFSKRYKL